MGTTLQINDTSLKKIKHMGDQKKRKGLWELSKTGSWMVLLSDSWLA